ncbi:DUF3488 and transglutaminase-like domain-containing protein [Aquisalimonas lutea]|uniref:transglutaminase TgpA family protein n=1 Tax=Aquisalimonas lutea TaxID=1327750 RepID=UPI0025B5CECB|nr:DUF3488 and transglutaminase-like domain-containing protein [Aquisalimonas lutea]MDN3518343.1 DUF3488 and transglutaminase-like domain-containing protein [Aquisalimonas lutea]
MTATATAAAPNLRRSLPWLAAGLGLVIAPHAFHLPPWVTAVVVACAGARLLLARQGRRPPGRWLRALAVVTGVSGIYLGYDTLLGLHAGVALLCLLMGLKLLELRGSRDIVVLVVFGYFLTATQFLFNDSLLMAAYMLAAVWALTALLIALQDRTAADRPWRYGRLAAAMLGQSLPVMLILFVLFPRIPGPLWGMPDDAYAGMTGLSDEMTPGAISQLGRSDEVALRVEFDDAPPAYPRRYWRGPVLARYDGRSWRRAGDSAPAAGDASRLVSTRAPTDYTVTLEPHNQRWLLALDMPVEAGRGSRAPRGGYLQASGPVRERIRYDASSVIAYRLGTGLTRKQQAYYTDLPDGAHPRTRQLASRWRAQTGSDRALVEHGLRHFRREPFHYTLQPPRLDGDTTDAFLFDTRSGFCEHYAGAFAVLMRAAGIPARVVTGYMGGRMNPAGDYMIVRQSDAHAWVEVWLDDRGWLRVDPTAYVAPERVERGLAGALPDGEAGPGAAVGAGGLLQRLHLQWDAVNAYWHRWVLAYGPSLQQQLLQQLRLDSWPRLALALAAGIALTLAALTFSLLRRDRPLPPDPAAAAWGEFCRLLARRGLPRAPDEGPRDYARRAARRWPRDADAIDTVATRYEIARYGRGGVGAAEVRALRQAVRAFRSNSPVSRKGRSSSGKR